MKIKEIKEFAKKHQDEMEWAAIAVAAGFLAGEAFWLGYRYGHLNGMKDMYIEVLETFLDGVTKNKN